MNSTRISQMEATAYLLIRAMDDLADNDEFRDVFLSAVKMAMEFGNSVPHLRGNDNGLRLWKAFCAVAKPMKARGAEAWKTFQCAHLRKLDDNEVMVLVACWSQTHDPNEILEDLMEKSERGEIDENELVQQCDLIKTLHAVQEMSGKVVTAFKPRMEAWLATRG